MVFLRQIKDENGMLMVFGKPCIFMPVRMFIEMQRELEREFPRAVVAKVYHDIGRRRTIRGAVFFDALRGINRAFEKLSLGSPLIQMGALSLSSTGWGDYAIIRSNNDKIIFKTGNSPFAAAQKKELSATKRPVCNILAGMIAGAAEVWKGGRFEAREKACAATGKGNECVFEVKRIK
jgi:predicted hydrocarbon binding protein